MTRGAPPTTASAAGLQLKLQQQAPVPIDVRLQCAPGELLALCGPSGSGKTTVLRMIAGLHPAHGQVNCAGATWLNSAAGVRLSVQQRRVGLVFQQYALFPHMNVFANVAAALPVQGWRAWGQQQREAARSTVRELLARTNMEGMEERLPHQLSGGQRQRVALARALARQPSVLLLDEPFSAVDQQTRERLYRELAQLRAGLRIPMILVTHDMSEVQRLADSICLMHRGCSLQQGSVENVMRYPETVAAARLLGHKNLFQVQSAHAGQIELAGQQLQVPDTVSSQLTSQRNITALIAPAAVILHRHDRPSHGERENPIDGQVTELVVLGDEMQLQLTLDASTPPLSFSVSRHVAERNKVRLQSRVRVSILQEGIHLIPGGAHTAAP